MVAFWKDLISQHHSFNVLWEMSWNEVSVVLLSFLIRNLMELFFYSFLTILSYFQEFGYVLKIFNFTTSFFQCLMRNDLRISIAFVTHFLIPEFNKTLFPLFSNYIKSFPREGCIWKRFNFTTSLFQCLMRNDLRWSIASVTHFLIPESNETLFSLFSNYIKSLPRIWLHFEKI